MHLMYDFGKSDRWVVYVNFGGKAMKEEVRMHTF